MSTYTVDKVKKITGIEGYGFVAVLLRDGEQVGLVDQGDGGPVSFDMIDRAGPTVEVTVEAHDGTPRTFKTSPEMAALYAHCKGKTFSSFGLTLNVTPDIFVADLVDDYLLKKFLLKRCATKTCFRLKTQKKGEYYIQSGLFVEGSGDLLRKEYGDQLEEIYNETYADRLKPPLKTKKFVFKGGKKDDGPSNAKRAKWAEKAVLAFLAETGESGGVDEDSVRDLLADLLHLCDRENLDTEHIFDTSKRDWLAER